MGFSGKKRASSCRLRGPFLRGDEYVICEVVVRAKKKFGGEDGVGKEVLFKEGGQGKLS